MTPNKEGWYTVKLAGEKSAQMIEVYEVPFCGNCLCIWQEDLFGAQGFEQTITEGDEMCGHLPISTLIGAEWKFVMNKANNKYGN